MNKSMEDESKNSEVRKGTFVTLFPETENQHLTKDVGMIAYLMEKYYNYESKIVTYNNGEYPYIQKELQGFKIEFIDKKKGDSEVDGIYYLIDNGDKIDVLHLFHLNPRSLSWIKLYKKINPRGKVYLKLDANIYVTYQKFDRDTFEVLKMCDLITVETKYLYEFLNKNWGVKVEYIPNGFYDFTKRREVNYEDKENIILTVGRIGLYVKANEILMEAFKLVEKELSDWKIKLVGPIQNEFRPYMENFLNENRDLKKRIIFTGEIIDKEELEMEYRKAKIFCLTSKIESFGIVYVEAAKNGCFLLSSNVLPAKDVTDNKKYGDIFQVNDVKELSELLIKYTNDDEFLKKNCENIQKFAYSNFNWVDICNKINDYILDDNYSIINEEFLEKNREFEDISRIIESCPTKNDPNNIVFEQRLRINPDALKMSFWENHFELESLDKYPEIAGHILDFGCGSGQLDIYLARKGIKIYGIDLSEIGINIANYLRNKEGEEVKERLSFELIDVTKGNPKNYLYDSIWSAHVFERILDPELVFQGLKKWVKKGGYMLISVPLGYAYNSINHIHHFMNDNELRVHLEKYIEIIRIDNDFNNMAIRALCKFPD